MLKEQSANLEQKNGKFEVVETKPYEILVGHDKENKPMILNLNKDPHLLVLGNCRSGKSKMLQTIITNIIANDNNTALYISQISKFDLLYFEENPKVQFVSKDINELNDMLNIIVDKLANRQSEISNMIKNFQGDNIEDYNSINNDKMNYIYLVLDDFGFILNSTDVRETRELKQNILSNLNKIVQRGRSCGIQIITSTVAYTEFRHELGCIFNLSANKLAFKISDKNKARMLIGDSDVSTLPDRQYFILNNNIKGFVRNIDYKDIEKVVNKK